MIFQVYKLINILNLKFWGLFVKLELSLLLIFLWNNYNQLISGEIDGLGRTRNC
uniref:Uncharacterized protein n=1 Tax=Meloidogyne enterolobii TaxID=390850 RepID=A0A6V7U7S4_MELEN|nr:unnamed protein product [Meloidogyne enterolobii]